MNLTSARELANTRQKLARLEARYEILRAQTNGNERVRDMNMTSLKHLINQFKQEIAVYNTRQPAHK